MFVVTVSIVISDDADHYTFYTLFGKYEILLYGEECFTGN